MAKTADMPRGCSTCWFMRDDSRLDPRIDLFRRRIAQLCRHANGRYCPLGGSLVKQ